jgi:hypothetical protein
VIWFQLVSDLTSIACRLRAFDAVAFILEAGCDTGRKAGFSVFGPQFPRSNVPTPSTSVAWQFGLRVKPAVSAS